MRHAKYITFEDDNGNKMPIIFPRSNDHSVIAQCIKSEMPRLTPVSAGFVDVSFSARQFIPYGKSTTLGLECDEQDKFWLNQMFDNLAYL